MQRGYEYTTTVDVATRQEPEGWIHYTSKIPEGTGWVTYQHNTGRGVTSWMRVKPELN